MPFWILDANLMASKALVNLICGIKERRILLQCWLAFRLACAVEWELGFRVQIRKRAVAVTEKQSEAVRGLLVCLVTSKSGALLEKPTPKDLF